MNNFESRKIIEALRSGVPSRNVSKHFTATRVKLLEDIKWNLENVKNVHQPFIISAKYGEGKTHALNSIMLEAQARGFVVTKLSISKETPIQNLNCIYSRLSTNTFLPDRMQPGFDNLWDKVTAQVGEKLISEINADKLKYLLKALVKCPPGRNRDQLLKDLSGEFISKTDFRSIWSELFQEKAPLYKFAKTREIVDYFALLSYLFSHFYAGWVILFDEAELIGKFPKVSRLNAYAKLGFFMFDDVMSPATLPVFAFNSSFKEEVIEGKNDLENLILSRLSDDDKLYAEEAISAISGAQELKPLSEEEMKTIINDIIDIHQKAYNWQMDADINKIVAYCNRNSSLLRTKIRTAIEMLDQLYQFGECQGITIGELTSDDYDEVTLDELLEI